MSLASFAYTLDAKGRRTWVVEAHTGRAVAYVYDRNGEIATVVSPAGRVDLAFDTQGRLIQVQSDASLIEYDYDVSGIRVEKMLRPWTDVFMELDGNGVELVSYVYGQSLLSESSGAGEMRTLNPYVYGENDPVNKTDPSGAFVGGGVVIGLVVVGGIAGISAWIQQLIARSYMKSNTAQVVVSRPDRLSSRCGSRVARRRFFSLRSPAVRRAATKPCACMSPSMSRIGPIGHLLVKGADMARRGAWALN